VWQAASRSGQVLFEMLAVIGVDIILAEIVYMHITFPGPLHLNALDLDLLGKSRSAILVIYMYWAAELI
jgi:hypothetical protein